MLLVSLRALIGREWRLVVSTAAVGAMLAGAVAIAVPRSYVAESKVAYTYGVNEDVRFFVTKANMVASLPVARLVGKRFDPPMAPEDVLASIDVEPVPNTSMVRIRARGNTPDEAAAIANEVAARYVDWTETLERQTADERLAVLAREVKATEKRVRELEATKKRRPGDTVAALELEELSASLASLLESYHGIERHKAYGRPSVVFVSEAGPSLARLAVDPLKSAMAGLLLGAVFGIYIAATRANLSGRVSSVDAAVALTRGRRLAVLHSRELQRSESNDRCASLNVQGLNEIAAQIRLMAAESDHVSVLVSNCGSSATAGIASEVALNLARGGERTVVIGTSLDAGSAAGRFDVAGRVGLSEVLSGETDVRSALFRTGCGRLVALGPGIAPLQTPSLESVEMDHTASAIGAWARYVLLDVGNLAQDAAARRLVRHAKAIVLVVEVGGSYAADLTSIGDLYAGTLNCPLYVCVVTSDRRQSDSVRGAKGAQKTSKKPHSKIRGSKHAARSGSRRR